MSRYLEQPIKLFNRSEREDLLKRYTFKQVIETSRKGNIVKFNTIYGARIDNGTADNQKRLVIPLYQALKNHTEKKEKVVPVISAKEHSVMNDKVKFLGSLREVQLVAKGEVLKLLNSQKTCILSLHVGAGKTITAINIACQTKVRTLIIVNRILLCDQWESAIKEFTSDETQVTKILKNFGMYNSDICNSDFYIINAINIPKLPSDFRKSIGFVIVDECHLLISEIVMQSFLYLQPAFLLGLSATPYRNDGLDSLMDCFFGPQRVQVNLNKEHTVFKVKTEFIQ